MFWFFWARSEILINRKLFLRSQNEQFCTNLLRPSSICNFCLDVALDDLSNYHLTPQPCLILAILGCGESFLAYRGDAWLYLLIFESVSTLFWLRNCRTIDWKQLNDC